MRKFMKEEKHMGMSTWSMEQLFRFPEGCGEPVRAESVNVTPQYSDERTDNSYRLTGIYHMTCMAVFNGEEATPAPAGATMIEEIDMDGETGYFEYAVPLYIDLPADKAAAATLKAHDVRAHITDDGAFCISWKVDCEYGSDSPAEEKPLAEEPAERTSEARRPESSSTPRLALAEEEAPAEAAGGASRSDDVSLPDEPDEARAFIAGLEDTYTVFSYPSYKIFVKSYGDSD